MFKDVITTNEELKEFRTAVRAALTPALLTKILTEHTVTDPGLVERLNQAVGKKSNKPLSTRLADDVSAAILQFNNAHEMFAHYSSKGLVSEWLYSFSNEHDDGVVSVFAEDGYELSVADIVYSSGLTFDPSNELESLHYSQRRQFSPDKLPKNAVVMDCEMLHGMCILFSEVREYDFCVTDDHASAADIFSGTAEEAERCFFANSMNDLLRHSEKTTFFENNVREHILKGLLNALVRSVPQYSNSLLSFDPSDVKGEEYRWDDGTVGLMFSSREMWMVAYDAKNGKPIAMSSIRLHQQDKRRSLIRA